MIVWESARDTSCKGLHVPIMSLSCQIARDFRPLSAAVGAGYKIKSTVGTVTSRYEVLFVHLLMLGLHGTDIFTSCTVVSCVELGCRSGPYSGRGVKALYM